MAFVTILIYVVAGLIAFMLFIAFLGWALGEYKVRSVKSKPAKEWKPTKTLKHTGLQLFHLPFSPVSDEVIYLENEYDKDANQFILDNLGMISDKIKAKGFRFVYLPALHFSKETLQKAVQYHYPDGIDDTELLRVAEHVRKNIKSDFLLDYMVRKKNRGNIHSSFVWFNHCRTPYGVRTYIYDGISFVGSEALQDPELLMDEVCEELGNCYDWIGGLCCKHEIEGAEGSFSVESRRLLEEVREKLDKIRLDGVSEAVIAEYIRPKVKLSALHITHDLKIFLTDYQNKEVVMEPLNKAVYFLFLRHPEGILFKNLPDYRRELDIIYKAIKNKENDIDAKLMMESHISSINPSILAVTDPLNNSINEKCARIREAFLILMPDRMAESYYITGTRGYEKTIALNRELVSWEILRKEGGKL